MSRCLHSVVFLLRALAMMRALEQSLWCTNTERDGHETRCNNRNGRFIGPSFSDECPRAGAPRFLDRLRPFIYYIPFDWKAIERSANRDSNIVEVRRLNAHLVRFFFTITPNNIEELRSRKQLSKVFFWTTAFWPYRFQDAQP